MIWDKKRRRRRITSFQVIIIGYAAAILLGSLLLKLPPATQAGISAPFADALFTATSAVCVTGLVVHDTATYWSGFGQAIILILIQIGGMGVVTIAVALAAQSGRRIGLMQRSTMKEAISAHQVGGIVRLTKFIIKTSLLIELFGALFLAPTFCHDFGKVKGCWYALFHAISAFCNAGFDLIGVKEPYTSMTPYANHAAVNGVLILLIVIGGIGFLTWEDIKRNQFRFKKYHMQSKVILSVTLVLIVFPALFFYYNEFSTLAAKERLLSSLFQSVTTRTAGFNTVELNSLSDIGQTLVIMLMIVGGSPGSTAGGIKTTTLAVLIASAISVFMNRESACVFGRRIANATLKRAMTIFLLYLVLFLLGGILISAIDGIPLLSAFFEAGSAIGTVGLTLGITSSLSLSSKMILMLLMFFGRVGGLTLIFAAFTERKTYTAKYPEEDITVG